MVDRKTKLQRIIQIGIEVSQIKDLDVLLEKVLSEARYLVHADAGSIYIKEENNLKFSYSQNETLRKRLEKGKKLIYTTFSMPITNKSIAGSVALSGELLNIPDAYKIPPDRSYSFDSSYDKISGYETHSMLTVPLKNNRGDCIGVLQLINAQDDSGNPITESRPVRVLVNGEERMVPGNTILHIRQGERITLFPGVYHDFWPVSEYAIIGEVSTRNDDAHDNYFENSDVGRYEEIDEDEPAIVRLLSE